MTIYGVRALVVRKVCFMRVFFEYFCVIFYNWCLLHGCFLDKNTELVFFLKVFFFKISKIGVSCLGAFSSILNNWCFSSCFFGCFFGRYFK